MLSHKTRIVELIADQRQEQPSRCSMMLVFLMIFEDDFGAQGEAPYKAIGWSKSRKTLAMLAPHTPRTMVRMTDGLRCPLGAVIFARLITDSDQTLWSFVDDRIWATKPKNL